MQTTKARSRSLEVPKKASVKNTNDAAQTSRKLKMSESEYDSLLSNRTPRGRSSKVTVARPSRSPVSEVHKKRPNRISDLESQVSNLQEELNKTREQLDLSDSRKRHAQQEAEEAKKQLIVMNAKLEESQRQLLELSASEDARHQELCKLSQERDRAWESELDAVRKQYTIDSAAFVSSMNEIQRLKLQLEMVKESEANWTKHAQVAHAEIERLKQEHLDALALVERMKIQLSDSNRKSEAQSDGPETMITEVEHSKAQSVSFEEEHVGKIEQEVDDSQINTLVNVPHDSKLPHAIGEGEELNSLKSEIVSLRQEVNRLQSALEITDDRHCEEHGSQTTRHIPSSCETVQQPNSNSALREATINTSQVNIENLKENLMASEAIVQENLPETEGHSMNIDNNLLATPQKVSEESELLKSDNQDKENEHNATELADTREVWMVEQLEAALAANSTMEIKLQRLQVQADQWRKAAEAATAILSTQGNDMIFKMSTPVDKSYDPPFFEGMDEDLLNKRNNNMLRKIGSLWKKGPK